MISVILPVFNGEKYLADAIESILCQSFAEFELLVIDDGSIDNTKNIVFTYRDSRVKYYYHSNRGLSLSLNHGIELAKYELIARMDADDISLPDRLKIQYEFLVANPGIDIVGGQIMSINQYGEKTGVRQAPTGKHKVKHFIEFGCPVFHPTYLVKKYVYSNLGGYRNLMSGQDYDFLMRASESGYSIDNVPEIVLKYREHDSGISQSGMVRQPIMKLNIIKMHRLRIKGQYAKEAELFETITSGIISPGKILSLLFRIRSHILNKRKQKLAIKKFLLTGLYLLVSFSHPQLAKMTYYEIKTYGLQRGYACS